MKIFLSSTIRDIKELRIQLKKFITKMGYDARLSEFSDILYDPEESTHLNCISAIPECDMLIIVITGRFGGEMHSDAIKKLNFNFLSSVSSNTNLLDKAKNISITQAEVLKAIESNIPIYTFIEKGVYYDHYINGMNNKKHQPSDIIKDEEDVKLRNFVSFLEKEDKINELEGASEILEKLKKHGINGNPINYPSISKVGTEQYIFNFIDFLRFREKNNAIIEFESSDDIINHLKKQWAMYFQRLIEEKRVLNNISNTKKLDEPCNADWSISERTSTQMDIVEVNETDTSNLFFFFLSVRDCRKSREIILKIKSEKFNDIKLEAMYDLMGSWDLVIKYRANRKSEKFKKAIISELLAEKMIDRNKNKTFGRRILINVLSQSKSIFGLINKNFSEKIYYTLLPDSQAYDNYRSNRAFIFIELPNKFSKKNRESFLSRLSNSLTTNYGASIIESICESKSALIIETFSRCSQSNVINHLNKAIEPTLTTYGIQKYTLLCYNYDEIDLLNNLKGK